MTEKINTYLLSNPYEMTAMDRKDFYDEQFKISLETGKPTRAVEVVNVLLFNESWEMILQKRSSSKRHNPNLIDKAVWGHITHWDTADYTVMVETIQELQVPSIVLKNHDDFKKTYGLLSWYLQTIAIIEKLETRLVNVWKILDDTLLEMSNKTHLYMWIYGWSVKNVDHEAKWILFYSLEELEDELNKFPAMFTQDIHLYFNLYRGQLYTFRDSIIEK